MGSPCFPSGLWRRWWVTSGVLASLAWAGSSPAQFHEWTVTNLHPAGVIESFAYGAGGATQAGTTGYSPADRAALGGLYADCDGDGMLTIEDFLCFQICYFIC